MCLSFCINKTYPWCLLWASPLNKDIFAGPFGDHNYYAGSTVLVQANDNLMNKILFKLNKLKYNFMELSADSNICKKKNWWECFLLQQFAMGIIPLCSEQFRKTFNTTRIPLKEQGNCYDNHNYFLCLSVLFSVYFRKMWINSWIYFYHKLFITCQLQIVFWMAL